MAKKIDNITSNGMQKHIIIHNTSEISLLLKFIETESSWFFDVTYSNVTYYNIRMALGSRLLEGLPLPFDFYIRDTSKLGLDPVSIYDFEVSYNRAGEQLPARCELILLEEEDI